MTDPIADMLTRIRNALLARKKEISVPYAKIKFEIARILKKEGYLKDFEKIKGKGNREEIRLLLKYINNKPSISVIKRISKPGCRIYSGFRNLPKSYGGLGILIISTPKGLMTDKEARIKRLGGEIICEIF